MTALFNLEPVAKVRHPATYTDALLPVFVGMLRGSTRVLATLVIYLFLSFFNGNQYLSIHRTFISFRLFFKKLICINGQAKWINFVGSFHWHS